MKPEDETRSADRDAPPAAVPIAAGVTVTHHGWNGRTGRIVSHSPMSDYDWLVAWSGTNMLTHERSDDLHIEIPAEARIVPRRPPARADRDTHAALPSKRPLNPGLALVPAAVSGRPRRY